MANEFKGREREILGVVARGIRFLQQRDLIALTSGPTSRISTRTLVVDQAVEGQDAAFETVAARCEALLALQRETE